MKRTQTINLEKGDWIVTNSSNYLNKKGKFDIGRVKKFKIEFDKVIRIDMDKKKLKEDGECFMDFENKWDFINKLNKKDLKETKFLITKLKTLKALEDENEIKSG